MKNEEIKKSFDGRHEANFTYLGEIRFGPAYYVLKIDNIHIKNRVFGILGEWLDNRYFAAEEWLTTQELTGPTTRLVIYDVETRKYSAFQKIEKGFVESPKMENDKIIYKKHYFVTKDTIEEKIDFSRI